jgi:hypothetical protein
VDVLAMVNTKPGDGKCGEKADLGKLEQNYIEKSLSKAGAIFVRFPAAGLTAKAYLTDFKIGVYSREHNIFSATFVFITVDDQGPTVPTSGSAASAGGSTSIAPSGSTAAGDPASQVVDQAKLVASIAAISNASQAAADALASQSVDQQAIIAAAQAISNASQMQGDAKVESLVARQNGDTAATAAADQRQTISQNSWNNFPSSVPSSDPSRWSPGFSPANQTALAGIGNFQGVSGFTGVGFSPQNQADLNRIGRS